MRLKEIGFIIKNARLEKKYSQKQVSDFAEISQGSYSKIESGKMIPTINIFLKICYMLELYFDDFIDMPEDVFYNEDPGYDGYIDPETADAMEEEEREN